MAGRPPSKKSFAAALRIAIKEAGSGEGKDKLRDIADKLVTEALAGNMQAIKEIADRIDGKVAQQVNVADNEGGPLQLTIVSFADATPEQLDS